MKKLLSSIFMLLANCSLMFSQVGINNDGSTPDNSAILDVKSTSKGILIPRLTFEQRKALSNPADGLMVLCLDCGVEGSLSMYSNGTWKSFSLCTSAAPGAGNNVYTSGQIVWNWTAVQGATGYRWNTTNYYSTAIDMGTGCSKTETGITGNTDYTRYVWSYNSCSNSEATTLTKTTYAAVPATPISGSHVPSLNQIVWNWNTSTDATGYKWNTINDCTSATDLAASTTMTESGLNCGTSYTRYIWAYNGFGYSAPASLNQATFSCSTCGISITINHVAGNVAPVSKTVIYGTVTNIPGETNHCWITSNLGSNHQAIAVNDTTEASAGWYWQFNQMQGFKHDGTTRTPNSTWIISIDESSDWSLSNDPCAIELGSGWRIPTSTEWINVDAIGNWVTWIGPWNSALKIHAAGNLYSNSGALQNRGIKGMYWSSTQGNSTYSNVFNFTAAACSVSVYVKPMGHTLRCIHD
jgi:hypothetical protein